MADETESTATSETTTEQTAETTAETGATEASTETTATEQQADDLGETALGGKAETEETTETEQKAEVPETYELAVPEGFEKLDEQTVAAATPVLKELGLSNDQANRLVPVVADFAKRIIADRDQQFIGQIMDQRKGWLEEAKADPEIGGAQWDTSLQSAAKALDQLGFPKGSKLRVALDESGFGNHPELIRAFAKVGKAIGEDNFERSDTAVTAKKTDAELFYGKKD